MIEIFRNGLDITTGAFLDGPSTLEELNGLARGEPLTRRERAIMKERVALASKDHLGTVAGVAADKIEEAGWGVIFARGYDPAIKEALQPLLDWRKERAGKFYKEFSGDELDRQGPITSTYNGETKLDFTDRHGADGSGPVDPANGIPYYLLLVGDPDRIPYKFQYQMDVQYAVGRIHFDTIADYAQYAHSVVQAEKHELSLPRRATFFGVSNDDDDNTRRSAEGLIQGMSKFMERHPEWKDVSTPAPSETTRENLVQLMRNGPALLMTASHGAGIPITVEQRFQQEFTGALVCQDWPGPEKMGTQPIPTRFLFKASDVPKDARLHGSIFLLFACYSGGMPMFDDFPVLAEKGGRPRIANASFVSRLPKRLLTHPDGGVLAVIAHVERAWSAGFEGMVSGTQLQTFRSTWTRLMEGAPVGCAMEFFNTRYAETTADLAAQLQTERETGFADPKSERLARLWLSSNDARNYVVIGDPAVRLRLTAEGSGPVPMPSRDGIAAVKPDDLIPDVIPPGTPIQIT
jgi:hypothetical protein